MKKVDKDTSDTMALIMDWLREYPTRRGIVVLFDEATLSFHDIANTSGMKAAEFATRYRDFILKETN